MLEFTIVPDKRLDCKCGATWHTLLKIRGKHGRNGDCSKVCDVIQTGQNACLRRSGGKDRGSKEEFCEYCHDNLCE